MKAIEILYQDNNEVYVNFFSKIQVDRYFADFEAKLSELQKTFQTNYFREIFFGGLENYKTVCENFRTFLNMLKSITEYCNCDLNYHFRFSRNCYEYLEKFMSGNFIQWFKIYCNQIFEADGNNGAQHALVSMGYGLPFSKTKSDSPGIFKYVFTIDTNLHDIFHKHIEDIRKQTGDGAMFGALVSSYYFGNLVKEEYHLILYTKPEYEPFFDFLVYLWTTTILSAKEAEGILGF